MMDFRWVPNKPIDPQIIARMKAAFATMPSEPPPHTLYSREKQQYHENLAEAVAKSNNLVLKDYMLLKTFLSDTGSGLKIIFRFQLWISWYLYLLPRLIEICAAGGDLLQDVMNYIFNVYESEISEEYPGFREDVLGSLGQILMLEVWWSSPEILTRYYADPHIRFSKGSDGDSWYVDRPKIGWTSDFNSSMFLCLKYLKADEIAGWVESIALIDTHEWKFCVKEWLVSFKTMQHLLAYPAERETYKQRPPFHDLDEDEYENYKNDADYLVCVTNLSWDGSHIVFFFQPIEMLKRFFPEENLAAFWEAVDRHDWMREALTSSPD